METRWNLKTGREVYNYSSKVTDNKITAILS